MRIFRPPHSLTSLRTLSPRPEWRASARQQLTAYVAERPAVVRPSAGVQTGRHYLLQPRWAAAGLFVVLLLSATGAAAEQSMPTDILYPVKIAGEKIQLALSPSPRSSASLRLHFAQNRLSEAAALTARGSSASEVTGTFAKYEDEVRAVASLVPSAADPNVSANDDFLRVVRTQLAAQQAQLRQAANPVASSSGEKPERRVSESVRIRALRALKVSTESEEATLPSPAPKPPAAQVTPAPAAAAAVSSAAEISPPPPPAVIFERSRNAKRSRGAAGVSGEEVSTKLKQNGEQLAKLVSQLGQSDGAIQLGEIVNKVAAAQAALGVAQGDYTSASARGEYVDAYRRALKAYQTTLDAEMEFESHRGGGSNTDRSGEEPSPERGD